MSVTLDLGGNDIAVNSISTGTVGSTTLLPVYEYANVTQLGASSTSFTLYVNGSLGGTFQVAGASVVFGTASTSGTAQVEVATGTQAVGSGTNQLTGTMSLAGTANTTVNGTVIASPTTIAAGSRVNIILAGTLTSLANCSITVVLKRIS
jgi:hypothetical protein